MLPEKDIGGEGGPSGGAQRLAGIRVFNLKAKDLRLAGWLAALGAVGVLLLTVRPAAAPAPARRSVQGAAAVPVLGALGSGSAGGATASATASGDPGAGLGAAEAQIGSGLARILSRVVGVGAVTVQVHLVEGPVTDYAMNTQVTSAVTTQPSGGTMQTNTQRSENDQVVTTGGGVPAVRDVRGPQVAGVLVVATGARSPVVSLEISQAVQAATGVPAYRIVVLPAQGGSEDGAS